MRFRDMSSHVGLSNGFFSRSDSQFSGESVMTNAGFSKVVSQCEWKNTNKVDEIYCRICLGSTDFEDLISPCHCTGTIGIVHLRCLEKWLNLSRLRTCEICGYKFEVLKSYPHFSKWLWMGGKGDGSHRRRHLWTDLICLLIMLPLLTLCAWLAISSNQEEDINNTKRFPWQSFFLGSLCSLLLLVFNIWLMFSLRYHHQSWKLWRKEQCYIVLSESIKRKKVMNIKCSPNNSNLMIQCDKQEQNQKFKHLDMTITNKTNMRLNNTIEDDCELATNSALEQFKNSGNYSTSVCSIKSEIYNELNDSSVNDEPMTSDNVETISIKEEMILKEKIVKRIDQRESINSFTACVMPIVPSENDALK
ncbi:hypothetical protein MN116_003852 [Schistosoma mekongi]|uniref:RING-CH-type domain-containing protein n=1 Tax=Schistosoma mekongi TaxID=38744 RepID=A0AAE2D5Z8_SCHME|nr:hypothetical protein MN116_003852 [Schistosoma mekongi]